MALPRYHPLTLWRLTQQVYDHRIKERRPMSLTEAAKKFGVAYQTWHAWEKFPDEPHWKPPTWANMLKIYHFTGRQVRPDHFFDLPTYRAAANEAREAAGEQRAAG